VTLPDVHLADEAVVAYVDDQLPPIARHRAQRHLKLCPDCRRVTEAQREAKTLLLAAPDPLPPAALLARLGDIPMTADLGGGSDLGGSDTVLVVDGAGLAFAPAPPPADTTPRIIGGGPVGAAGRRPRPIGDRGGRPGSYPSPRSARPLSRRRRSLAGAIAGLAFGVIASTVSTTAPNTAAPASGGGGPVVPGTVVPGTVVPAVDRARTGAGTGGTLELNTLQVSNNGPRQADLSLLSRAGR
jgi:hypothetical protein